MGINCMGMGIKNPFWPSLPHTHSEFFSRVTWTHSAELISINIGLSQTLHLTLREHGKCIAWHAMPVYTSAFASGHFAYAEGMARLS